MKHMKRIMKFEAFVFEDAQTQEELARDVIAPQEAANAGQERAMKQGKDTLEPAKVAVCYMMAKYDNGDRRYMPPRLSKIDAAEYGSVSTMNQRTFNMTVGKIRNYLNGVEDAANVESPYYCALTDIFEDTPVNVMQEYVDAYLSKAEPKEKRGDNDEKEKVAKIGKAMTDLMSSIKNLEKAAKLVATKYGVDVKFATSAYAKFNNLK